MSPCAPRSGVPLAFPFGFFLSQIRTFATGQPGVAAGGPPRGPRAVASQRRVGRLYGRPMAKRNENKNYKVIAENRRARYDYAIDEEIECGIVLQGSEVKSLRLNTAQITESYAEVKDGELWLVNSYIAPYEQAMFGHEDRRRRKLLVSRREIARMWSDTQRKGMTLVPLVLYFNHRGIAKVKIGIARGKKAPDKRATEAKRDWQRQKSRLLKEHG
ncbi:MAG: SsrA-binding protein SmpB [Rhodobacteraceae bacterium HLUCCA09]|nr:MAG: SsrA-binding protein SmpB [Rhodobacteraceae bacterium HLUCCA09]